MDESLRLKAKKRVAKSTQLTSRPPHSNDGWTKTLAVFAPLRLRGGFFKTTAKTQRREDLRDSYRLRWGSLQVGFEPTGGEPFAFQARVVHCHRMGARNSFGTNAEYVLARALTAGLGLMPRFASVAIGRCLGRLAYHAAGRLRFIGERNLRIAYPKLRRSERRRLLRRCFDHLGRQLGEFCQLERATAADLRKIAEYDPETQARFREARSLGRGMIIVTAHLGSWEILALASSAFGDPAHILVRPIQNPKVDQWIQSVRARFGNQIISKQGAGMACMRILKKGGILAVLADLNALPQEGVFVPFFGELACTTLAVAALALPTNAVVFPVFAPWNRSRRKYVLHGGPALEMLRTGDHDRDLAVNTARITSLIEREIRAFPEQWMWIHDRWHALYRAGDRVCADFPLV